MNAKVSLTGRKLKWLAPLAALALLAGAAQAMEMLLIPDDTVVPIYSWGFDDVKTGWTATIFYHPPKCVPENYNLLINDADPNMDPNCPMLMEGFTLWEEGAAAPSQVVPGAVRPRRRRTARPVNAEISAVAIVMPADGPSFGTPPAGTWIWKV